MSGEATPSRRSPAFPVLRGAWTYLAALALSLGIYRNREEILAALLPATAVWLLPAAALLILGRCRGFSVGWVGLIHPLGLLGATLLPGDGRPALRALLQVALLWLPLFAAVTLPDLWRLRWRLLAAATSTGLALALVAVLGSAVMEGHILPLYELGIDHRLKPRPGYTNRDGVAPDLPPESYRREDETILFLGDSFTYGFGIEPRDAFPILLEGLLQQGCPDGTVRVANFGWVSASPVLSCRQLRQIGAAYHPDVVAHALDMTDFNDDIVYRGRLAREGWDRPLEITIFRAFRAWVSRLLGVGDLPRWISRQLVEPAPAPAGEGFWRPEKRFFPLWQPLEETRPLLEGTWETILEIHALTQELGAEYVLFVLPRYVQYDRRECPGDHEADELPPGDAYVLEPFRYFQEKAAEAPFPIHSLLPDFQSCGVFPTTLAADPHYNEAGHWVCARAMERYLREDGLPRGCYGPR